MVRGRTAGGHRSVGVAQLGLRVGEYSWNRGGRDGKESCTSKWGRADWAEDQRHWASCSGEVPRYHAGRDGGVPGSPE